MPPLVLTTDEQAALQLVLELRPYRNRRNNPALQPLSLYSSELKGLRQIAGLLYNVHTTHSLSPDLTTRARYFNTLSNLGLVTGTSAAPELTPVADFILDAWNTRPDPDNTYWQDRENELELHLVRTLVEKMIAGEAVSEVFKIPWFNAQTFFDSVPLEELPDVLTSADRLLFLFRINSAGWEIARYFRLSTEDRAAFEVAFNKVLQASAISAVTPIAEAAANYKFAAGQIQADVRFRIKGFLNAYATLKDELDNALPRLDKQLILRSGISAATQTASVTGPRTPLRFPLQLIVTGCPGSGKSHYVDSLIKIGKPVLFRTQFHSDTSYFDFFGAYKPQPVYEPYDQSHELSEGNGSPFKKGRPLIDYRFVPGPLVLGLVHALMNPTINIVLLIEEINRGNAAAIFGDILQLLDRDDDGRSRYGIQPTPELCAYCHEQGLDLDLLQLPPNLYLWATMNSADQGVFTIDTAFRRRWNYVYKGYSEPCMYPADKAMIRYGGNTYQWDTFRKVLNTKLVEFGIHEDKLVGPYFLTESQLSEPDSILEKLFLYLWDDVLRFRQNVLFTCRSFSEVGTVWANGGGNPLSLDLNTLQPQVVPDALNHTATPATNDGSAETPAEDPMAADGEENLPEQ